MNAATPATTSTELGNIPHPPKGWVWVLRRPAWFDEQCQGGEAAATLGRAWEQLVREHKRVTRDAKRRFEQLRAAQVLYMLKTKDPEAYRLLQQRSVKHMSPIKAARRKEHEQLHFGQPGPTSEAHNHRR